MSRGPALVSHLTLFSIGSPGAMELLAKVPVAVPSDCQSCLLVMVKGVLDVSLARKKVRSPSPVKSSGYELPEVLMSLTRFVPPGVPSLTQGSSESPVTKASNHSAPFATVNPSGWL